MRNSIVMDKLHFRPGEKTRRKPLRSFSEMADEFGLTPMQLRAVFFHARQRPLPAVVLVSRSTTANSWYDPQAFRAWWALEQESRNAEQNQS